MLKSILLAVAASIAAGNPKAAQLLVLLIELFWPKVTAAVPEDGLELVELDAETKQAADTIALALNSGAAPGDPQTLLGLDRIRRFAKWLEGVKDSPLGKILITFFEMLPK